MFNYANLYDREWPAHGGAKMEKYRAVCVHLQPCARNPSQRCAVAVATGNWTIYDRIWSVSQMTTAIAAGDAFFIECRSSGQTAALGCATCPSCEEKSVILAESGAKSNLDLLRLPKF
jgi:hypothetical protein